MARLVIRVPNKGKSCGRGWTTVTLKSGRQVRKACVRGRLTDEPRTYDRITDALIRAGQGFD